MSKVFTIQILKLSIDPAASSIAPQTIPPPSTSRTTSLNLHELSRALVLCRSRIRHLNRKDTTEWSIGIVVRHLDKTEVGLSVDSPSTRSTRWDCDSKRMVLVNVCRPGANPRLAKHASHQSPLLRIDIPIRARDLCRDIRALRRRPFPRCALVDQRLQRAGSIGRHDVEGAVDAAAGRDLRESRTGEHHGRSEVGKLVVARARLSVANVVVGGDVFGPEDCGVCFGEVVWSCASDDAAFDAESCAVAAEITGDDGDFTVGGDEGYGCCESDKEGVGEHFE